jgi:DNA-binding PadR family transcriptional regulator
VLQALAKGYCSSPRLEQDALIDSRRRLYAILDRLERRGLVCSHWGSWLPMGSAGGQQRRRLYDLTSAGWSKVDRWDRKRSRRWES